MGDGTLASSDAMSLDASRHLWNLGWTRGGNLRGGYLFACAGSMGIIYDQPLV